MNLHCDFGLSTVIFLHVIWQCQGIQLPTDPEKILFDVLSFGISLTCVKIKGSFLCQTSVKGWRFSWVQLFFSSYNRCLSLSTFPAFTTWFYRVCNWCLGSATFEFSYMAIWYTFFFWNSNRVSANTRISETLATAFYQRICGNNFFVGVLSRSS